MPGLAAYVGSTEAEARAEQAEVDAPLPVEQSLAQLSAFVQQNCGAWGLDAPVPELPPLERFTGPQGRYATILRIVAIERPTVPLVAFQLLRGPETCAGFCLPLKVLPVRKVSRTARPPA